MLDVKQVASSSLRFELLGDGSKYLLISPVHQAALLPDLDQNLIRELFKEHGALAFRKFSTNLEIFTIFSDSYMSGCLKNYSPGRALIDEGAKIQSVNLGSNRFPLHPELSQTLLRPEVCWFFCIKAPKTGGETTLCDGTAVPAQFTRGTLALLLSRNLKYKATLSLETFQTLIGGRFGNWREALQDHRVSESFHLEPGTAFVPQLLFASKLGRACARVLKLRSDQIFQNSILPCLYKPKFSDKLAFGNFILFSRLARRSYEYPTFDNDEIISDSLVTEFMSATESVTSAHSWQPGDILMVDNTRFMHGRNKIDALAERTIYTRFGYLNF